MKDPVERAAEGDEDIAAVTGLHEGRVTLCFGVVEGFGPNATITPMMVDHYKLTVERAEEMVEGLVEAIKISGVEGQMGPAVAMEAKRGKHVARVELETIDVKIGTLPDGRLVLDFGRKVDFLKMGDAEALVIVRGLQAAIKQARAGAHIPTDSVLNPSRRH